MIEKVFSFFFDIQKNRRIINMSLRAVIIGINYIGTDYELKGAINDAKYTFDYLLQNYPITKKDIKMLTDSQSRSDSHIKPTIRNVKSAMKWLVKDSTSKSHLFLHFSGHGAQMVDYGGEESDDKDESIRVLDGVIRDDDIQECLFDSMAKGAALTAIFDCCHSGSILDLDTIYNKENYIFDDDTAHKYCRCIPSIIRLLPKKKKVLRKDKNVVCFSAAPDSELGYGIREETKHGGKRRGALSYYLFLYLEENPTTTYNELFDAVKNKISRRLDGKQTPVLNHCGDIDLNGVMHLL
jgi:hypothetical protein